MITRNLTLMSLACCAIALPQIARSQGYGTEARNWELTLSASGSNDNEFDNGGFSGSASLGYFTTDQLEWSLRQDVDYRNSDLTGSTTIAATRFGFDFHFQADPNQRLIPFVGANLGGIYGDGIEEQFIAAPEVGFKFYVTPRAFLLGLAEYQFLFEDSNQVDDSFDDGRFVYTLGFGFNW